MGRTPDGACERKHEFFLSKGGMRACVLPELAGLATSSRLSFFVWTMARDFGNGGDPSAAERAKFRKLTKSKLFLRGLCIVVSVQTLHFPLVRSFRWGHGQLVRFTASGCNLVLAVGHA